MARNVRTGPGLAHPVLALLAPGQHYRVIGTFNGWDHVVLAGGASGWILRSLSAVPAASSGAVVTAGVRLHWGAGLARPVVGLVAPGTHVQVIGARGSWVRVRLAGGRTGYVLGTYVKR